MVIKPLDMVKIINEWCEKRHLYYADFQKMETLGYIRLIIGEKKAYVRMIKPDKVRAYMDQRGRVEYFKGVK